MFALAKKLLEKIKIGYAAKLRELEWYISDDMLQNIEVIEDALDFEEEPDMICNNIRKLTITEDNADLNKFARCWELVAENVIHLEVFFPEDSKLYLDYLAAFNFKLLKNVEELWLMSTNQAELKIPESVRQLTLQDCQIKNIDFHESLKEIIVMGEEFSGSEIIIERLKAIAVPKQKWVDQQVDINEVGVCKKFSRENDSKELFIVVEPRRIGSNNWSIMEAYLKQYIADGDIIDHVFINVNNFKDLQNSSIISIVSEARAKSVKISTTDSSYYDKVLRPHAEEANQFGHQIVEIELKDSNTGNNLQQFYYNRELHFMHTENYEFFETHRNDLKYLVLKVRTFIDPNQAEQFLDYCKGYNFLMLISSGPTLSKRIQELSLNEGTHIFNEYLEVLKKAQRTEVIFKNSEKNVIDLVEGFATISSTDTTYRFEFDKNFTFTYDNETVPSTFLREFVKKLSKLHDMERMELATHSNLNPFIIYVSKRFANTKQKFSNLTKLAHISIESFDTLSDDFGFVFSCFPAVKYVTVKYPKLMNVLNQSFDNLCGRFRVGTAKKWSQLPFLGNRLVSHFIFADVDSMNPTNEEMDKLMQTPSLVQEFAQIIESKRPNVLADM